MPVHATQVTGGGGRDRRAPTAPASAARMKADARACPPRDPSTSIAGFVPTALSASGTGTKSSSMPTRLSDGRKRTRQRS